MKKSLILGALLFTAPAWAGTTYPLTIETYNYEGQKVSQTFEKAPERIFAAFQDNIETLLALGVGDKIVGAYGFDDPKPMEGLEEAFKTIPYQQDYPGKEAVMALQPDFITGWSSLFGEKRLGDISFWNERGTKTYMARNSGMRKGESQTVEDELLDVETLGAIVDRPEKAAELTGAIRQEMERINTHLKGKTRRTATVIEDEGSQFRVYGHETLGGNVAERGGAVLKPGAEGDPKKVGVEDLLLADPEAIFLVWYEGYTLGGKEVTADELAQGFMSDPKYANLQAVKEGRVWPLNLSYVYCSGLRSGLGVQVVASHLYPELYQ